MLEWGPHAEVQAQFATVLEREVPVELLLTLVP
jgi:hypothetical protein